MFGIRVCKMMTQANHTKKVMMGMLAISLFVLIVAISSLYVQHQVYTGDLCGCVIPVYLFVPFIGALGLFIGTLAYYLLSPKFQEKKVDKSLILALLRNDEAKVVKALIAKDGRLTQAQLSKLTGMSKLQVFRAVERLEMKGVVEKIKDRKVNVIKISEKFRELLV